jgi:hypothetical protein
MEAIPKLSEVAAVKEKKRKRSRKNSSKQIKKI